ncbi:MAG: response regulator transcription factor [Clostridia bacterium]|nr:response regulator transcription factor [Clostridia bacterium]
MHSIMIVDDEKIIREGLIRFIDWEKYGFNIVADAENGKKAIEIAQKVKPEIILSDIYMPIMDGIEFAKEVRQCLPETVIIFLSGYNEFNYAQRAIELGVFRYLVKPIQESELLAVLGEACEELEHRELEKTQVQKLKMLIKDSLPLLKERFFLNLVRGKLKENEINNKLEYLNINLDADRFSCLIISLDDYISLAEKQNEDEINLIKFAVQNISGEVFSETEGLFFMFEEKPSELGVLACHNSRNQKKYMSNIYPSLQKIKDCVWRYFKTTISIGLGRSYKSLSEVSKSYREAESALEFRTAFGKNNVLFIGDINPADRYSPLSCSFEKLNELVKTIKGGDLELSCKHVDEVLDTLKSDQNFKKDHMQIFAIELLVKLEQIVLEFDGDVVDIYGEKFSPLMLMNYDTLEGVRLKLKELIESTLDFINSKRKAVNRNFIEKAKDFIDRNYALEDLNLGIIADNVYVSPGYLSQLFKQVVGESYIEYLTKVRINHAKRLLKETNLKAYEIAEKVGYTDSQYFSTCFKKVVGVSPTDYRDIISKDISLF